jgi:hypothetical protein
MFFRSKVSHEEANRKRVCELDEIDRAFANSTGAGKVIAAATGRTELGFENGKFLVIYPNGETGPFPAR